MGSTSGVVFNTATSSAIVGYEMRDVAVGVNGNILKQQKTAGFPKENMFVMR